MSLFYNLEKRHCQKISANSFRKFIVYPTKPTRLAYKNDLCIETLTQSCITYKFPCINAIFFLLYLHKIHNNIQKWKPFNMKENVYYFNLLTLVLLKIFEVFWFFFCSLWKSVQMEMFRNSWLFHMANVFFKLAVESKARQEVDDLTPGRG